MQYTIYEYQKQYRDLFQQYHHLQDYLTHLKNDDIYTKKLKQSFYQDVSFLDDIIYPKLSKRQDYKKKISKNNQKNKSSGPKAFIAEFY